MLSYSCCCCLLLLLLPVAVFVVVNNVDFHAIVVVFLVVVLVVVVVVVGSFLLMLLLRDSLYVSEGAHIGFQMIIRSQQMIQIVSLVFICGHIVYETTLSSLCSPDKKNLND